MEMKDHKEFRTSYLRYSSISELPAQEKELLEAATRACEMAYAPYSRFFVGAAIRTGSGQVITGANQENASFPIGACAERVAVYQLKMKHPGEIVSAIAITAKLTNRKIAEPVSPCGSCRQILVELEREQKSPIRLILRGSEGPVIIFEKALDLLPFSFNPDVFLTGM